jgi:hypothetical protein
MQWFPVLPLSTLKEPPACQLRAVAQGLVNQPIGGPGIVHRVIAEVQRAFISAGGVPKPRRHDERHFVGRQQTR